MTAAGRILLTGATGFIGRRLLRSLLADGIPPDGLSCLVRDPSQLAEFGLPAAAIVQGSLADRVALDRATAAVRVTCHLAGAIKAFSRAEFLAANAQGTANLIAALEANAPRSRLVLVSSLAAAGPSVDGSGSAAPPERCRPVSEYGESKRQGELQLEGAQTLEWLVLRPPLVYGPGDSATRLLFRQALAPFVPVPRPPRPLSIIHVDDVVAAVRLAAAGTAARVFLPLDGPERLDTDVLMRMLAAACGRRARLVPLPLWLGRCGAWIAEGYCRLRGRPGIFSRDKLREVAATGWVADGGPVRRALGFAPAIGPAAGFAAVASTEGFAATVPLSPPVS